MTGVRDTGSRPFAVQTVEAIERSIAELRLHGRDPVRIRMHPDDAAMKIWGIPIFFDEDAKRGAPVAEMGSVLVTVRDTGTGGETP